MKRLCIAIIALLVIGCSTPCPQLTPEMVTVVHTQIVESTVEVTRQVEVTSIVKVTSIVEVPVTVTPTPTPKNTPTPTNTPTITPTPTNTATPTNTPTPTATPNVALTATADALGTMASPKSSGFYLVGVDIVPGKWRSTGAGDGCYWVRTTKDGDIIDNHFGTAGGTVTLKATDFQVEFDDCGRWIWVENEVPELLDSADKPKGNGFYTVGVEIIPGLWRSTGTGDGCYWARLDGNQNLIANHFGQAGGTITVSQWDYEIEFNDCGTWEYIGP